MHRPGLPDHARRFNRRCHIADATHQLTLFERRAQVLILQHSVLQRYNGRVCSHHRPDLGERLLGVPQLDAQQDDVGDADLFRIVSGVDLLDVNLLGSVDTQSVAAHRLEMLASSNEINVGATMGQSSAEIAADSPRSHDCDTHRVPFKFFFEFLIVGAPIRGALAHVSVDVAHQMLSTSTRVAIGRL